MGLGTFKSGHCSESAVGDMKEVGGMSLSNPVLHCSPYSTFEDEDGLFLHGVCGEAITCTAFDSADSSARFLVDPRPKKDFSLEESFGCLAGIVVSTSDSSWLMWSQCGPVIEQMPATPQ